MSGIKKIFARVDNGARIGRIARWAGVAGVGLSLLLGMSLLLGESSVPAEEPEMRMPASTPYQQEPITPIPAPPAADPRKLALGERLFDDKRLSHDGRRACSSCHDTRTNGADANRLDTSPTGSALSFNTNTVFNAALSFRLHWEGSFRTLEAQAETSLESPLIMATSFAEIQPRLGEDRALASAFREVYGRDPDRASILDAIATYERSLLTVGSRFDLWLNGDASALSAEELGGYQLFKSMGCISCHQGVNVGGNLFARHGIFHPLASPNPEILRVPSLRNVATTPPYFHDGSAPTLDTAVRRMGEAQLDRKLSSDQIEAIVAFLKTLTGTYRGHPVEGPAP